MGQKYYRERTCPGCGKTKTVRADSKAEFCNSCAKQGPANPNFGNVKFQGSLNDYKNYHRDVSRARGKASKCVNGCVASVYHWANLTGKYEDVSDYEEMCPTCHAAKDRGKSA